MFVVCKCAYLTGRDRISTLLEIVVNDSDNDNDNE